MVCWLCRILKERTEQQPSAEKALSNLIERKSPVIIADAVRNKEVIQEDHTEKQDTANFRRSRSIDIP